MSTHLPGFQSFFIFILVFFCIGHVSHQQHILLVISIDQGDHLSVIVKDWRIR